MVLGECMKLRFFKRLFLFTLVAVQLVCAKKQHHGIGQFNHKSLADKVTIIVTTSPIKSNPRTHIIEQAEKGLFLVPSLRDCRKIIVFDGVREDGYSSIPKTI